MLSNPLGKIRYNVGYLGNQWLLNKLTKYQIDFIVVLDSVFIDKSNPMYQKLFNKRKFVKLKPVMLFRQEDTIGLKYQKIRVLEGVWRLVYPTAPYLPQKQHKRNVSIQQYSNNIIIITQYENITNSINSNN